MTRTFLLALFFVISTVSISQGAALCRNTFRLSKDKIIAKDRINSFEMRDVLLAKERGEPTTVVYFNSLTYFLEGLKDIKGYEAYSNRLIGPVIQELIKNPSLTAVYPTNFTVTRAEILHFIRPHVLEAMRANPALIRTTYEQGIMARLKVVPVKRLKGTRILAHHLLADPVARAEIMEHTAGRNAYVQPYIGTRLETKVAAELGLPLNASPRANLVYGNTKSGNHELFRKANVPHPLSKINLESRNDVAASIYSMWKETGHKKYMIKLEESTSGKGNADFLLTAKMLKVLKSKTEKEAIEYLNEQLYTGLNPQGSFTSKQYWDIEFAAQKSVMVEQFIAGYREGVDPSPSFQFHIGAGGRITVISTHEQLFHPVKRQTFIGSRYPAKGKYRKEITDYGIRIAEQLAKHGMIGHGGVDFIVTKDGKIYAIEVNARMNGTSHSLLTAKGLQKDLSEDFYSISTDNFESPLLKKFKSIEELLEHPEIKPLLYDINAGAGVTFHIMGAISIGKIGFQAIAPTQQKARRIYNKVLQILDPK